MNCTRATQLVSESLERALSRGERWQLRLHLVMCSGCRCFAEQAPQLRRLCQHYPGDTDEPNTDPATHSANAPADK